MKKILYLFAVGALLFETLKGNPPKQYNLLVIQTDEHHFKTLGCYGGKIVKTPNIDWIAKNGAIATSFYATTPVCSPSRGSLMSGKYPQHTPVTNNNIKLGDDIVTFAEVLRRKGYATGYAGKWHLDGGGKPQWEPKRRFGFEDNRFMFNRGHWKKFEDTREGPRVGSQRNGRPSYDVDGADEKSFSTDWLTNKVVEFVNTNKGKSFCYMVSYPDPHGPNKVRSPYNTMYADAKVPIPRSIQKTLAQTPKWGGRAGPRLTADTVRAIMPNYYGMVKCIDDNVGTILKTLRKHEILDRTVIVFTADHGDLCGEHGRLNKGVPYEGSARIPFLLHCPGKVPAGTVVDEALSCVDFLPTTLSLMGIKTAGKEQGRDASALFKGQKTKWNDVSFIRSTSAGKPWLCVVTNNHKLVFSAVDEPWFYDLSKDPDEMDNRFGQAEYAGITKRLTHELLAYCKEFSDPYAATPAIKSSMLAALKKE